ncbi:hypothetical protein U9M48_030135 [Paspalum notatum var. saurae]|uniref:Uncharacterized protein n=1 Tax=Paspalum notatum var. saurae TaxID=547442 RepID=A0AAQ3X2B3_PASNO
MERGIMFLAILLLLTTPAVADAHDQEEAAKPEQQLHHQINALHLERKCWEYLHCYCSCRAEGSGRKFCLLKCIVKCCFFTQSSSTTTTTGGGGLQIEMMASATSPPATCNATCCATACANSGTAGGGPIGCHPDRSTCRAVPPVPPHQLMI